MKKFPVSLSRENVESFIKFNLLRRAGPAKLICFERISLLIPVKQGKLGRQKSPTETNREIAGILVDDRVSLR